ncbi:hypothetical protein Lal_00015149 [Lupinus albus]|nr:hypothetical protein Lal_00015149 [Lupinus albus]
MTQSEINIYWGSPNGNKTRSNECRMHAIGYIVWDKIGSLQEQEKKRKNISLKEKVFKYESSEDEYEKEEMEDMSLLVKKFSKFIKRNKGARTGQMRKFTKNNDASTSNQNFTCFECGKLDHMKMDSPNIKRNFFKGKNEMKTGRRAYIAWEENDQVPPLNQKVKSKHISH